MGSLGVRIGGTLGYIDPLNRINSWLPEPGPYQGPIFREPEVGLRRVPCKGSRLQGSTRRI